MTETRVESPIDEGRGVLLVSMPLMDPRFPSLALSLLKPLLVRQGIPCEVRYLSFPFQARVGRAMEPFLVGSVPWIWGDWPFAGHLFDGAAEHLAQTAGNGGVAPPDILYQLRAEAGPFLEWCIETVPWDRYSVVGFTVRHLQQTASLALARRIKERHPSLIVALGGPNCSGPMGAALLRLFPFVDWVFSGEADLSFPEAVKRHSDGRGPEGIPGVSFREGERVVSQGPGTLPDLDSLPLPDHEDFFRDIREWCPHLPWEATPNLELSRGCWWRDRSHCLFCSITQESPAFRAKSPERALFEIRALAEKHTPSFLLVVDSVLDPDYCRTLMPLLAESGPAAGLILEARATLARQDWILLKRAGAKVVQMGIESLDTELLVLLRKGTTFLQNVRALKWARELGIPVAWSLVYGIPGETSEAYARMAERVPSLTHLHPPNIVQPIRLERFSPLYRERERLGLGHVRPRRESESIYPFRPDEMEDLVYEFECEFEGKEAIAEYTAPMLSEVRRWAAIWECSRLPILAFERSEDGTLAIYDTRPGRTSLYTRLEGIGALAHEACETGCRFGALGARLSSQMGVRYPGDDALGACLHDLLSRRLMVRDGGSYLSLACDLDRLVQTGGSQTARLLAWLRCKSFYRDVLAPAYRGTGTQPKNKDLTAEDAEGAQRTAEEN